MAARKWGEPGEGFNTGNIIEGHATEPDLEGTEINLTDGRSFFIPNVNNRETAMTILKGTLNDDSIDWRQTNIKAKLSSERKRDFYLEVNGLGIFEYRG